MGWVSRGDWMECVDVLARLFDYWVVELFG
jgi:hypothetical protein